MGALYVYLPYAMLDGVMRLIKAQAELDIGSVFGLGSN